MQRRSFKRGIKLEARHKKGTGNSIAIKIIRND